MGLAPLSTVGVKMEFNRAMHELIPTVASIYESWLTDSKALHKEAAEVFPDEKITCHKGCGTCCHFPLITVTAGEAFVLLIKLLASGETLENLHAKLTAYTERYFSAAKQLGSLPFSNEKQRAFVNQKLACPFLDTDNSACGIYPIRPLICDSYHSTSDVSLCTKKQKHGMFDTVVARGEEAIEELRHLERSLFGRSALGHLPLLLAALCTKEGMESFLQEVKVTETEPPDLIVHLDPAVTAEDVEFDSLKPADQHLASTNEAPDLNHQQHMADFDLFVELMNASGYAMSKSDIADLIAAQEDMENTRFTKGTQIHTQKN